MIAFFSLSSQSSGTSVDDTSSFSFAQISDLHCGAPDENKQLLIDLIDKINCSFVDFTVISGDLIHMMHYDNSTEVKNILSKLHKPWYAIPGNHDVGMIPSKRSLSLYREHFGKDYYYFVHQQSLFVFVNTQLWMDESNQEVEIHDQWLQSTLQKKDTIYENIIVLGHLPLFTDSINEKFIPNVNIPLRRRLNLLKLFSSSGVTAFLSGHLHRFNTRMYNNIIFISIDSIQYNADSFRIWKVGEKGTFFKINHLQ